MSKNRSIKARTKNSDSIKCTQIYSLEKLISKTNGPDSRGVYRLSSIPIKEGIVVLGIYENNKLNRAMLPQFDEDSVYKFGNTIIAYDKLTETYVSFPYDGVKTFIEENAWFPTESYTTEEPGTINKESHTVLAWITNSGGSMAYHIVLNLGKSPIIVSNL